MDVQISNQKSLQEHFGSQSMVASEISSSSDSLQKVVKKPAFVKKSRAKTIASYLFCLLVCIAMISLFQLSLLLSLVVIGISFYLTHLGLFVLDVFGTNFNFLGK